MGVVNELHGFDTRRSVTGDCSGRRYIGGWHGGIVLVAVSSVARSWLANLSPVNYYLAGVYLYGIDDRLLGDGACGGTLRTYRIATCNYFVVKLFASLIFIEER